MDKDILERHSFLLTIAKEAGDIVSEGFFNSQKEINFKGIKDIVTEYDTKTEKYLMQKISHFFGDDLFLAEESFNGNFDALDSDKFVWILDPIDGTSNFAHNIPFFAVSIGLWHRGEVVSGVVNNPVYNEFFNSIKGGKSYLNDSVISCSNTKSIEKSLIATGLPYDKKDDETSYIKNVYNMLKHVSGLRKFGAASLDMCYTACGRFDGYWESGTKPWDVAASLIIAKNAGCVVSSTTGSKFDIKSGDIALTNPQIHKHFIDILKN